MKFRSIIEYLERSAKLYPDKIIFASDDRNITYSDFVKAAKKVGSQLVEKSKVAVLIDRSVDCLIAVFGAAYANACYTVIDIESPAERNKKILSIFAPQQVITDSRNFSMAQEICGSKVLIMEELLETEADCQYLSDISRRMIDTDPFFVIFTSGSTGVPKGTVLCQRSLLAYIEAACDAFGIDSHVVWGNQAPFYYIMSALDVYSTVVAGATLYIIPKQYFSFPGLLIDYINANKINSVYLVPSVLTMIAVTDTFSEYLPRYLERVLFSGEVMPVRQLNYWIRHLPGCLYANLYGATEITDSCTYYIVNRHFENHESLPIGIPFKNCEVIVIDDDGKRVLRPEDGQGILYVRGAFLGLGYYSAPEKTQAAFVLNPLNKFYPELLYCTNDYVCFNDLGELLYKGRADHQIKHMGYRIELGEIEYAASSILGVNRASCIYDKEKQRIVLFYSGNSEEADIRKQLLSLLPAYMMPTVIVNLESLPLTSSGKVNRIKLKALYDQNV